MHSKKGGHCNNTILQYIPVQCKTLLLLLHYLPSVYLCLFLENLGCIFSRFKDIPIRQNVSPSGLQPLAVGLPGQAESIIPSCWIRGWLAKAARRHRGVHLPFLHSSHKPCSHLLQFFWCHFKAAFQVLRGSALTACCVSGTHSLIQAVKRSIYCSVQPCRCSSTTTLLRLLHLHAFIIQQTDTNSDKTAKQLSLRNICIQTWHLNSLQQVNSVYWIIMCN